jgi:hypothetical protein
MTAAGDRDDDRPHHHRERSSDRNDDRPHAGDRDDDLGG